LILLLALVIEGIKWNNYYLVKLVVRYAEGILSDNEIYFDHKIPVTKGGRSHESNVYVLCEACNKSKRDRVVFYG
jgi:5-methylcytosine-specific restriction endonuclease McrA